MIKNDPIRTKEIRFENDCEFSGWLKAHGWKGDYVRHNCPCNTFVKPDGQFICRVHYDNSRLTYKVFVRKEMEAI